MTDTQAPERWPLRRCDWRHSLEYPHRKYGTGEANAGKNEAEYQIWLMRKKGKPAPSMEFLTWRLHAWTIHKMNVRLERTQDQLKAKLKALEAQNE